VAGERAQAARPSGRHNLRSRKLAAELVRGAGIVAGDLAVDVGAGTGAITRELDRAGARVLALELDHQLAGDLRRSFAGSARVRVVEGDALRHAWPDEPFAVVANVPFARTTELLRALLDPRVSLERAELVRRLGARVQADERLAEHAASGPDARRARRSCRTAAPVAACRPRAPARS